MKFSRYVYGLVSELQGFFFCSKKSWVVNISKFSASEYSQQWLVVDAELE